MLEQTLIRARRTAQRLAAIPGLEVLRGEHLTGPGTGLHQLDETKLLIGTSGLAAEARDILARLNERHGVQPELSGHGHLLCITTIGNTDTDMERLVSGLTEVAEHVGRTGHVRERLAKATDLRLLGLRLLGQRLSGILSFQFLFDRG